MKQTVRWSFSVWLGMMLLLTAVPAALAWGYNYLGQEELRQWLESGRRIHLVDIQPAEAFARQHFPNAIETNAFPVKSAEERQRLDKVLAVYQQDPRPVVVICPRGKGGARRCYDYLKARGIPENQLLILRGGMDNWPYPDLVARGR